MNFRKLILLFTVLFSIGAFSQEEAWPRIIETEKGAVITLYQPQPESLNGNILEGRAAISVKAKDKKDPVFGAIWYSCVINSDRETRIATLESISVTDVRFPNNPDSTHINTLKNILVTEIPKWDLSIDLDRLAATLEEEAGSGTPDNMKHDPPVIIFEKQNSVLVIIDGEPKWVDVEKTGVKRVVNSAFIILQDPAEKKYYLNGNGLWYSSASVEKDWTKTDKLSAPVKKIADDLLAAGAVANPDSVDNSVIPKIIVATKPTELIQSDGEPEMTPIKGTELLYVKNSEDNIFMEIVSQSYFVLISGRWYESLSLTNGPWNYISSELLPGDFALIPPGSEKDIVLASVAGTSQAIDAIHDAQVPQTASVDRKTTTTKVEYDGEPKFEKVDGAGGMEYAVNTSSTVLKVKNKYYCVDDGVWFESASAKGPWTVATERPDEVEEIDPSSPVYNVKYVYIYDSTPEVVYVGYTPGYMGCYVYGPTVIYGTGYYYTPWYGAYYYPRPVTYGFSMHYNPWTGWSMGMSMSVGGPYGWMSFGFHSYPPYWGPPYGGCWGPHYHYPPHYHPCNHYYGNRPVNVNNINIQNNNYYNRKNNNNGAGVSDNMYRGRDGVNSGTTRNNKVPTQTGKQTQNLNRQSKAQNNVYADKNGNVYKGNSSGKVQQHNGTSWDKPTNSNKGGGREPSMMDRQPSNGSAGNNNRASSPNSMDRQMQNRNAGATNRNNYNQYRQQSGGGARPSGSSRPMGGGGGGMRGGRR